MNTKLAAPWISEYEKVFHRYNHDAWSSLFGLPLLAVDLIYSFLEAKVFRWELLLTLNFLKEYRTHTAMAATWNKDPDTISHKIWRTLEIMAECLPQVCIYLHHFFMLTAVLG